MPRNLAPLAAAAFAAALSPSGLAIEAPAAEAIHPIPVATATTWSGPQAVQAGRDGRAYVLDLGTYEVYPYRRTEAVLGPPEPFETIPSDRDGGPPVLGVSMSLDGEWMTFNPPNRVRYFERDREAHLPLPTWEVTSVGWWDDRPAVGVLPHQLGGPLDGAGDASDVWDPPPVLLAYDSRRSQWEPIHSRPLEQPSPEAQRPWRSTVLASGPKGSTWLIWDYRYQVLRLDRTRKIRDRFTVGTGEPEYKARTDAHQRRMEEEIAKRGGAPRDLPTQIAAKRIRAAAGHGDRLYLLTTAGEGPRPFTLDRYAPDVGEGATLERVALALPTYRGRLTLAAAKDGLMLTHYRGTQGRHLIPWAVLDVASWEPVEGAQFED
ncbi:MAG: hypothetical protein AAGN66_27955 [Acidobacteriota bacterium]